jgi:hypothetical protein
MSTVHEKTKQVIEETECRIYDIVAELAKLLGVTISVEEYTKYLANNNDLDEKDPKKIETYVKQLAAQKIAKKKEQKDLV